MASLAHPGDISKPLLRAVEQRLIAERRTAISRGNESPLPANQTEIRKLAIARCREIMKTRDSMPKEDPTPEPVLLSEVEPAAPPKRKRARSEPDVD